MGGQTPAKCLSLCCHLNPCYHPLRQHCDACHHNLSHHSNHQQTEPVSEAKLKAANGLAQLDGRRYKQAARAFVSINPELGTNYSDVSSSRGAGGLCVYIACVLIV